MSRPIRFQMAGLVYHVMGRGNNRMTIYRDARDYARFFGILRDVIETYQLDCWTVCGMPNHYHLAIRTREANLSLAIRHLNGSYAQWWNKRHAHVGHVFQARFKAQIVDASAYLLRLCRYILLNPVRAKLCADPGDWQWSSYRDLIGVAGRPPCVDVDSLLRRFGDGDIDDLRARFIDFVRAPADPEIAEFVRGKHRVIGGEEFARQFQRTALKASKEVPARERRIGTPPLVDVLTSAMREPDGLASGIAIAHKRYWYPVAEIARCAGLSAVTVRRILKRDMTPGSINSET